MCCQPGTPLQPATRTGLFPELSRQPTCPHQPSIVLQREGVGAGDWKNHCRPERGPCAPILKIFVFPLFYISEGLDIITPPMTTHLAGWRKGQV